MAEIETEPSKPDQPVEELTVYAPEGSRIAETLEPLADPRVRAEVARRLSEAGLRVTVIQVPSRGRHRRK